MLRYDESYYEKIANEFNYIFCKDMTNPLPKFSCSEMQKWLCGYNLDRKMVNNITEDNTFITLGVGTNSEPHIGTIAQILRGIYFQAKGYKVQIVLGDIDSYNSRSSNMSDLTKNVEKYSNFINKLGFDTKKGTIRDQLNHAEIMKTAFLISSKVQDKDFEDVEENI